MELLFWIVQISSSVFRNSIDFIIDVAFNLTFINQTYDMEWLLN